MKRLFTILLGVLLWTSLYQIVTGGSYSEYAESLFSFWAWWSLIFSVLLIVAVSSITPEKKPDVDVSFTKLYGVPSTVLEMIALAATGNFLFATGKAVQLFAVLGLLGKIDEIENKK